MLMYCLVAGVQILIWIERKYYLFMHWFHYKRIWPVSEALFYHWALRGEDNWQHRRIKSLTTKLPEQKVSTVQPCHPFLCWNNTCSTEKAGQSPDSIQLLPHIFSGFFKKGAMNPSVLMLLHSSNHMSPKMWLVWECWVILLWHTTK